MAFGYAYSILGDLHAAEDAAQEAFLEAYRCLSRLRCPAAFPGWFRKIVLKSCDRLTRRKSVPTVPLGSAGLLRSDYPGPAEQVERREMADRVLDAIRSLPQNERTVTTLFYIDGYSHKDIAEFLEVPVTTVANRLRTSRKRLKERMVAMVEDELKGSRPGPEFPEKVMREISRVEVRPEKSPEDHGRVVLVDELGRCLMIAIDRRSEWAIQRGMEDSPSARPSTHELMASVLDAFGISVQEARVMDFDFRKRTYFGELVLARKGDVQIVDCNPSDAIVLATIKKARITLAEKVFEEVPYRHLDGTLITAEELWETPEDIMGPHNERLLEVGRHLVALSNDTFNKVLAVVGMETMLLATTPVGLGRTGQEDRGRRGDTAVTLLIGYPEAASEEVRKVVQAVRKRLDADELRATQKEMGKSPTFVSFDEYEEARKQVEQAVREIKG